MKEVKRYMADDNKMFDTAEECVDYERKQEAGKAIRDAYKVAISTGRPEALLIVLVNDPDPMIEILTKLKQAGFGPAKTKRVLSDQELTDAFAEHIRLHGKSSLSALYKGRCSIGRAKEILQDHYFISYGNKWGVADWDRLRSDLRGS